MWFKNMKIFRLGKFALTAEQLAEQLARGAFRKCPANEPKSRGWIAPKKDGDLVANIGGQWLIALRVEERLLPASVIREEVAERAEKMAEQNGYPPGRKQLRELAERVTEELMPRAFTRSKTTHVWIDQKNGWVGIDATGSKVEEVIEHLHWSLDDLPIKPIHTALSPMSAMCDWLAAGEAPIGFTIDRDCELKSVAEDKAAVRYVRHPLEGDETRQHLAAGKLPTRLALTWDNRISFVLTEHLELKRLAFLDLLKEAADQNAEHASEQFDADLTIMAGELTRFLPALLETLGGEVADLAEQGKAA